MPQRALLASFLAAAAVAASGPAVMAEGVVHAWRLGVLAHDVPELWSGFSVEDDPVSINGEIAFAPALPFLGGNIRPVLGGSLATGGGTSLAYLDARWEFETAGGLFFAVGLGAAVHDGQTDLDDLDLKALGSRVLFHIPVELGYRFDDHNMLSVYFEHVSNGETADPNEGLDNLGVRYGYRY